MPMNAQSRAWGRRSRAARAGARPAADQQERQDRAAPAQRTAGPERPERPDPHASRRRIIARSTRSSNGTSTAPNADVSSTRSSG